MTWEEREEYLLDALITVLIIAVASFLWAISDILDVGQMWTLRIGALLGSIGGIGLLWIPTGKS